MKHLRSVLREARTSLLDVEKEMLRINVVGNSNVANTRNFPNHGLRKTYGK
jgi:hypothetical protein